MARRTFTRTALSLLFAACFATPAHGQVSYTFDVAATLIDGTSSKNQNVSMQIMPNPDLTSADLIGDAVDLIFIGIADLNTVLGNWNAGTPPAASANIPEPATLVVLCVVGLPLLSRIKRAR